jgi:hypothetical protein
MLKMRYFLIIFSAFIIIFSGCKGPNPTTSQSNDKIFQELQQKVPFTIIIPTYLPPEIYPYPSSISGPGKGTHSDYSTSVGIHYMDKNMKKYVSIFEENYENISFQPSNPSGVFINIAGINILQEETQNIIPSLDSKSGETIQGYYFAWVNNGININVLIYGYDLNESRKVIESMIK